MHPLVVAVIFLLTGIAACDSRAPRTTSNEPPSVRTAVVTRSTGTAYRASGIVRARIESPLSFQVAGRIAARLVDAGQAVRAGQPLLRLDERDLDQTVRAARADLAAADAALATAEADLARSRELHQQRFISAQAVERAELARREAQTRRDAAAARLTQAQNARGYAVLSSPSAGVLMEVTGEPGQVVAAGQPVALLAQGAQREIEVFFPEQVPPPARGEAMLAGGRALALKLREVAAAVDAQGRTRRARYSVTEGAEALLLGSVVRTRFALAAAAAPEAAAFTVPIGALDERGANARLWRVHEGRVAAVPVQVLAVDAERAQVAGPLAEGERVVALGTHLLRDGMAVRELPR